MGRQQLARCKQGLDLVQGGQLTLVRAAARLNPGYRHPKRLEAAAARVAAGAVVHGGRGWPSPLPCFDACFASPFRAAQAAFRTMRRGLDPARVDRLACAATVGIVAADGGGSNNAVRRDRLIATALPAGALEGPRPFTRRRHSPGSAGSPASRCRREDIFTWPSGGQIDVV